MRTGELLFGLIVSFGLVGQGWAAADNALPLVGRLSVVAGTVHYHSTAGEWSDALVNEPVAAGSGLRTERGAEAEWRGPGARVALAPASELRVLRLDGDLLQIAVSSGRIGIHLDSVAPARVVEIDLPRGGVWLEAPGDYDISTDDARGPAAIQVFAGKARLGGGLGDNHFAAAAPDTFSDWWRARDDADLTDPRPWPEIAGIAALASAGRWEFDPELGKIWYPSGLATDWAPYRDGVWRYLPPWGWTWIDHKPWGFAPSHFGRWARIDGSWAWVPGTELRGADYSPAVVAFLGTAGIGLSRPGDIGATPAVAWFPLAPDETIDATADADGQYRNRRFAIAVPRPAFAGGSPIATALVDDVPPQRFADAPVILGGLGIPPIRPVTGAAPRKAPPEIARGLPPAVTAAPDAAAAEPAARQPYVVTLRDAPVRALVRDVRKRMRVVAAIVLRPRPLASVAHSPHNRGRLAAARGGA